MTPDQLNKVKKILYTVKPDATFSWATKNGLTYIATLPEFTVVFVIPYTDIGDASFMQKMDAKLLIRWINTINKNTDN